MTKLNDIKAKDGKSTLLTYMIEEIETAIKKDLYDPLCLNNFIYNLVHVEIDYEFLCK